jgi:hypothetical protein
MATRVGLGTISLSSSRVFPPNSPLKLVNPVMFPPGRARLATNPNPTGDELELLRLLHGKVGWLSPLEVLSIATRQI